MVLTTLRSVTRGLSGFDLYGHPIGVHYRGSGTHNTKCGSFMTLVTFVLICINIAEIANKFFGKTG